MAKTEPTRVESSRLVSLAGTPAYELVESTTRSAARYNRRTTWLDAKSFVPLRTELTRGQDTLLVATTLRVDHTGVVPTPVEIRFEQPQEGSSVLLVVRDIDYEAEIPRDVFSVLNLVK